MNRTTFSLEIFGDHLPWLESHAQLYSDNSKQMERLKLSLKKAIDSELTDYQKKVVTEFYFNRKSITEISIDLGVNKSTVSRHLRRAKERLGHALKYGLYNIWAS